MNIKKYSFDDGKFEIHAAEDGSFLVAYRHGEFWQDMIGDNLIATMLNEIDDLKSLLSVVSQQAYEAGFLNGVNQ